MIKGERTQMVAATFVDSKGATPYAVKFAAAFLKNLGYRKVVMKLDGEHSIVALTEAAAREAPSSQCQQSRQWETIKQIDWQNMRSEK